MEAVGTSAAHLEALDGALVVAVDASPPAAEALRFAAELAVKSRSALHVLMVWNLVIGPFPDDSPEGSTSEQDRQREADEVLAAFVDQVLTGTTRPDLQLHALHANVDPLLERVSGVARHLVVGTRGRGSVADMLLGSTSTHLVQHARGPVTVVPSSHDR